MVRLSSKPVLPFSQASRDVKPLYHAAFPPEERPPYALSVLFSLQSAIDFRAYYDGPDFIGFAITEQTSTALFVFLFAIAEDQRSRGYGSAILGEIAEQAAGLPQVLCIEPMDASAPNYAQRQQRLAFYQKNGYVQQHRYFQELTETYEILATPGAIDYGRLEQELNRLSLGLLRIAIEKSQAIQRKKI